VFLLATGKQTGFSLIGQKLLQGRASHTRCKTIILGCLGAEHIREMIASTTMANRQTLLDGLKTKGLTDDTLLTLCEVIHDRTAGLPRLVYRVSK
jgi:hypothetical protein